MSKTKCRLKMWCLQSYYNFPEHHMYNYNPKWLISTVRCKQKMKISVWLYNINIWQWQNNQGSDVLMHFLADVWGLVNFTRVHVGEQVYSGRLHCVAGTQMLLNVFVFRAWGVPVSLFYISLREKNKPFEKTAFWDLIVFRHKTRQLLLTKSCFTNIIFQHFHHFSFSLLETSKWLITLPYSDKVSRHNELFRSSEIVRFFLS